MINDPNDPNEPTTWDSLRETRQLLTHRDAEIATLKIVVNILTKHKDTEIAALKAAVVSQLSPNKWSK